MWINVVSIPTTFSRLTDFEQAYRTTDVLFLDQSLAAAPAWPACQSGEVGMGGKRMIGSRYSPATGKRRDQTYEVVAPYSETGSSRGWLLKNEKDSADEAIVSTADLENPEKWQRIG